MVIDPLILSSKANIGNDGFSSKQLCLRAEHDEPESEQPYKLIPLIRRQNDSIFALLILGRTTWFQKLTWQRDTEW